MASKKSQSTGPKTVAGKVKSSQNARKAAIFTAGYLSWEDKDAKQAEMDAIAQQWGASDPSRQMILRTIEQSHLGFERMMYAECRRIEGAMQSATVAHQFCKQSGISLVADQIPYWFFLASGDTEKQHALYLAKVYDEADDLKRRYSDQLVAQAQEHFPNLYEYVLTGYKSSNSFLNVLGHQYKQSMPSLNLVALMNELNEQYKFHLIWAEAPERYQIIIDGIRATQMLEIMDLEKNSRYAASFQNRLIKGFTALAALDQHEQHQSRDSLEVIKEINASDMKKLEEPSATVMVSES